MRRTIILAAALAIILLGLWGTAVIYFDESRLKGIISDRLSEQLGRRVEIVGALSFRLFPSPRIDAENVVIDAPDGDDRRAMLRAQTVSMTLRVLPLLQGQLAPGQMQLRGAVINVASGALDEGRADPLAAFRSSARLLSGRSLRLQDVTLIIPGGEEGSRGTVAIDFIELDRFSLDRTVAFRFRGNLGDPPILNGVTVEGMLHVPSSPDSPVRLRDMQLQGNLTALDEPLTLTGDVTATGDRSMRLTLAGGRLQIGERSFDLSFNYLGGEKPAADLLLSGPRLDWLAFEAFPPRSMNIELAAALAKVSARLDLRSQLQFNRVLLGNIEFSGVRIDLRSQPAGLGVSLAAVFPGGLAEASGVITGDVPESLAVDVSLAEFSQLLGWLDLPPTLGGSGEANLHLAWPVEGSPGFRLEGPFDLWNGHWRVGRDGAEPAKSEFDQFSGEIRMSSQYLEIPGFELQGGDLSGNGWAAVDLTDGTLAGEIRVGAEDEAYLALSGSLAQPRLGPLSPASSEDQDQPAERQDDERDQ